MHFLISCPCLVHGKETLTSCWFIFDLQRMHSHLCVCPWSLLSNLVQCRAYKALCPQTECEFSPLSEAEAPSIILPPPLISEETCNSEPGTSSHRCPLGSEGGEYDE